MLLTALMLYSPPPPPLLVKQVSQQMDSPLRATQTGMNVKDRPLMVCITEFYGIGLQSERHIPI